MKKIQDRILTMKVFIEPLIVYFKTVVAQAVGYEVTMLLLIAKVMQA